MSVSIQEKDFDHHSEYKNLCEDSPTIGAIVTFTGLVRDFDEGNGEGLAIEHYPQMTEKVLSEIIEEAKQRWPIMSCRVVHRIGKLSLGEQIVFVGVNSAHREAAFDACRFIMDFLKTRAPFWKKALSKNGDQWVEAKSKDNDALKQWQKSE
jgi:molybdopterin synthase catalytic subunit